VELIKQLKSRSCKQRRQLITSHIYINFEQRSQALDWDVHGLLVATGDHCENFHCQTLNDLLVVIGVHLSNFHFLKVLVDSFEALVQVDEVLRADEPVGESLKDLLQLHLLVIFEESMVTRDFLE